VVILTADGRRKDLAEAAAGIYLPVQASADERSFYVRGYVDGMERAAWERDKQTGKVAAKERLGDARRTLDEAKRILDGRRERFKSDSRKPSDPLLESHVSDALDGIQFVLDWLEF